MTLELPEPPSVNHYWRAIGRGRVIVSAEGRRWRERAALVARAARLTPIAGPVAVSIRWHRSRRAGDLDNRVKVVLDVLRGLAYHDDRQVVELHAWRADDPAHPRAEVMVTPCPVPDAE